MEKLLIGFDCEYSGPFDAGTKHYMIAIGMHAMLLSARGVEDLDESLLVSLKPPTADHGFGTEFWSMAKNAALLARFQEKAVDIGVGMQTAIAWVDRFVQRYGKDVHLVCDCTADATWLDFYLAKYANHAPLVVFTGQYTGWPYVTDDGYRMVIGTLESWGLDRAIDAMHRLVPMRGRVEHDPANDAKDIVRRYALVMYARIFKQ